MFGVVEADANDVQSRSKDADQRRSSLETYFLIDGTLDGADRSWLNILGFCRRAIQVQPDSDGKKTSYSAEEVDHHIMPFECVVVDRPFAKLQGNSKDAHCRPAEKFSSCAVRQRSRAVTKKIRKWPRL